MRDRSASVTPEQDHEFELVLGNKQLFSVLFIVFVLLGVFFAMGYVMGRNAGPIEAAATKKTEAVESAPPATGRRSPVEISPAPATQEQPQTPAAAAPETTTPPATAEPPPQTPSFAVVEPKPGQTFLQVSAVAKPEAELLVEVLSKKGFHAIVAPGPNEKLFRVLVGPAKDDSDLGRTRTELEQAGFRPIPRKY